MDIWYWCWCWDWDWFTIGIGFGVGNYISAASPLSFTADLKAIQSDKVKFDNSNIDDVDQLMENFIAISKRGRLPGITDNNKLIRLF